MKITYTDHRVSSISRNHEGWTIILYFSGGCRMELFSKEDPGLVPGDKVKLSISLEAVANANA